MANYNDEKIIKKVRESVVPFGVLLALFVFLMWLIVKPMGRSLLWSIVFSYFVYPVYKFIYNKLFKGKYNNLAAAVSTGVIIVFMLIPMILVAVMLAAESARIYETVTVRGGMIAVCKDVFAWFGSFPLFEKYAGHWEQFLQLPFSESVTGGAVGFLTKALRRFSAQIVGSAVKLAYLFIVVTIASFFLIRDGYLVTEYVHDILPLSEERKTETLRRSKKMLNAVVYGILLTASVQGLLGGIGWWFVKLPNPIFFGFLMFIGGMIPFVGTPVIWIPGSIYLLSQNRIQEAVILLLWGFLVVSMVDNFIRPIFISEGSKIHILVIFIGIFGGLYNWGFLGLFIGPLILSIGLYMLDIYKTIVAERRNNMLPVPVSQTPEKENEAGKQSN